MRGPGFEPGSLAWKAKVLARLDYPRLVKINCSKSIKIFN